MYKNIFINLILFTACFAENNFERVSRLAGFSLEEANKLDCKGSGTGFVVTSNGHIITANHVVGSSKIVRATFKNGVSLDAEVLRKEPKLDLAVLKVDSAFKNYLKVSRRTSGLGDDVYTIGYPDPVRLGSNQKFTKGSISSITGFDNDSFFYQISVPVQPGNSGGPVVCDETGDVTGIIVWGLSQNDKELLGYNPQLINYALKSVFISPVLDSLEIDADPHYQRQNSSNLRKKQVVDSVCVITSWDKKDFGSTNNHKTTSKITLIGNNPMSLERGSKFFDPGATASEGQKILVKGEVIANVVGSYQLEYSFKDARGEIIKAVRVVKVVDTTPPIIKVKGLRTIYLSMGQKYYEFGAESENGEHVSINGVVNIFETGVYQIEYSSRDSSGNLGKAIRTVYVRPADKKSTEASNKRLDDVTLRVNLPMNNHGGTIGAAIALGSYKMCVYIDGQLIGEIRSGNLTQTFNFNGSGVRNLKITKEQTSFLGLGKSQNDLVSENYNFQKGFNEVTIPNSKWFGF